jgi:hypothetical protein
MIGLIQVEFIFFLIIIIIYLDLFADGNDFSQETISKNRNIYYQKQTANQITIQTTETISLVTNALNIHLNIGQNIKMNSSSIFMSLETASFESLSNKLIEQIESAQIHIPTNFNSNLNKNKTISLRVCFFFFYLYTFFNYVFLVINATTCFS